MKTILILTANPKDTQPLRLDEEIREIDGVLRRAGKRDEFELTSQLAVRPRELQHALLRFKPSIVHFSGHGTGEKGLVFVDDSRKTKLINAESLAGLFKLFVDQIECVIFNACYSEEQAKAICQHINYVIGMNQPIQDQAAIEFAVGFYNALGEGISYEQAFHFGCNAIELEGISQADIPVLMTSSYSQVVSSSSESEANDHKLIPLPKYLQDQYIQLQDQYNNLTQKLHDLSQANHTNNPTQKDSVELRKQIEQLEKERKTLFRQLEELDQKTKSQQLYSTMLRLGYKKQIEAFLKLVNAQSIQAFLIHGSPEHGQHWLLNRLVTQYLPNSITGEKLQIRLNRRGRRIDINTIWRELKKQVMPDTSHIYYPEISKSEISEIVKRIYQWQKTQNILLVFHHVNFIPEECLHQLRCEFWNPLVNQAKQTGSLQSKYKLLMFLVDYEGTVGSLDKLFTETIDPTQPDNPVKLPKINRFSEEELTDWMVKGFGELPVELTHNYEDTVQIILEESGQGIPEYVLEGIFKRCGFNYHEEIKNLWKIKTI